MTPCPRCEGGRMAVERDPVHGDRELVCLACGCCVYEPRVRQVACAALSYREQVGRDRMPSWEYEGRRRR